MSSIIPYTKQPTRFFFIAQMRINSQSLPETRGTSLKTKMTLENQPFEHDMDMALENYHVQ